MSWLSELFCGKKKEAAKDKVEWMPPPPSPTISVQDIFFTAIQEAHEEIYRQERELLNDARLGEYIKKTIKSIGVKMSKQDGYGFILVGDTDAGVPNAVWDPYCKIVESLFKTIDLPLERSGQFLKFERADLNKAFSSLKKSIIDTDEATRMMHSQGIYR